MPRSVCYGDVAFRLLQLLLCEEEESLRLDTHHQTASRRVSFVGLGAISQAGKHS